ncbi:hypothetical protein N8716_00580 [Pontimonas sp.]|nr:hypothetical protein [Pontimonas sp.]
MKFPSWWEPPWDVGGASDPDIEGIEAVDPIEHRHDDQPSDNGPSEAEELLGLLDVVPGQIRSRKRVRDLAEVFTQKREIDEILDMMPDAFEGIDIKFLEPSCGSGNFLVEILLRKIQRVSWKSIGHQERYEHSLIRALASIYGVDISNENVTESRSRLAHTILGHYRADANTLTPTVGFLSAMGLVLQSNILQGNALTGVEEIDFCDWIPSPSFSFTRVWSPAMVALEDRDLFWTERIEDENPVHYKDLATTRDLAKETNGFRLGRKA